MFGLAIIIGLNGAFETISAQVKGAGNLELIGIYLNRAKLIVLILFIPIWLFLR
jgi:Na+-driven multidrug efflux pump